MFCGLYHLTKETATHWIGKSGTLYPKHEYINHGWGGIKHGFKDLPHDDYPYIIKYETKRMFKCCDVCNCIGKQI